MLLYKITNKINGKVYFSVTSKRLNDAFSVEYTKQHKIMIGITLFALLAITYTIQYFIPILGNTPFWLKLMISTMVITFSFKNIIYLVNKLIINYNTRNKDE